MIYLIRYGISGILIAVSQKVLYVLCCLMYHNVSVGLDTLSKVSKPILNPNAVSVQQAYSKHK